MTVRADDAERMVIGAILLRPQMVQSLQVRPEHFWFPALAEIYALVAEMVAAGEPVDVGTVGAALSARGRIGAVGGYPALTDLATACPTAVNAGWYADQVCDAARRRAAVEVADRIRQIAETSASSDDGDRDAMLTSLAAQALALEVIAEDRHEEPIDDLWTWDQFLARPAAADDWVVPELIARQDVIMILGSEGAGKSWLSRQIAMCLPAGVHPFRPEVSIPPMRTLLVDLEVSETTLIRETGPMSSAVARVGQWATGGFVWHHPAGLNLRDRADADRLERRVAACSPDLIVIASLYNAYYAGRDSHEQVADEIRGVINWIRERHKCAVLLEHHMPKGDGTTRPRTPYGSSVWQRWVTHGRAMDRVNDSTYELVPFRGDRGVREWPAGVFRGGRLPVSAIWDQAEVDLLREASSC